MEMTDAELIRSILDGKTAMFSVLVDRYSRDVYGFAFYLTKNEHDANDIAQESFVKVWKNLKKFKPDQKFKSWLLAITRNTAIDYMRKRRHVVFSDFDDENGSNLIEDTLVDEERLADEIAEIAESTVHVNSAVRKLPDFYRSVLALRYDEDLSFEEISEVLKKPLNTVKSQHRRALLALRKIIAPKDGEKPYL
ncbi:MAG: sigma-70 family RNA polymerase sigma factor [Patescibacteria group bacterium]|nr:sigma-70 family RNA polymerase sigma factor [Patescibacteria group bacterium]